MALHAALEEIYGPKHDKDPSIYKETLCKKLTNYFTSHCNHVAQFLQKLLVLELGKSDMHMYLLNAFGLDTKAEEVKNVWDGIANFSNPTSDVHKKFIEEYPKHQEFLRAGTFRHFQ